MTCNALEIRDHQLQVAYLKHLRMLASEISIAISSITSNSLSNFQDSLVKQEELCFTLASLASSCKKDASSPNRSASLCLIGSIEVEIRETIRLIRDLTRQYTIVLNQAIKTASLLISLCKSHTGRSQEAHEPRRKHQTWSCEM
jgi:hypothetical protein